MSSRSGQKRKASVSMSRGGAITIRNPMYKKAYKPAFVPGKERISGYYGRYNKGRSSELKFFDTTLGFTVDVTGEVPATGQLNLIPQGTTESQRIGRKCVVKSIQIKGELETNFAAAAQADAPNIIYMYLVWDKQCNGAAAAATDVLTSATFRLALNNMANSGRFVILKKWTVPMNPVSGVTGAFGGVKRPINFYKKCSIPIEFSSTTGAITEIKSNNLFLLAGCSPDGGDDGTSFDGVCRLRYSDN